MDIEKLRRIKTLCLINGRCRSINHVMRNPTIMEFIRTELDTTNIRESVYRIVNSVIEIPTCPICGKNLKYLASKNRYQNHCSKHCANIDSNEKRFDTMMSKYGTKDFLHSDYVKRKIKGKYGVDNYMSTNEFQEKSKLTKLKRYGSEKFSNPKKTTDTCIKIYGTGRNNKKTENTIKEKYGTTNFLDVYYQSNDRNSPTMQEKILKTKSINNTFNTSKPEEKTFEILKERYPDVVRQYKSDEYPFCCDFYIPSIDTYIECNYHWTHGGHPYNEEKDKEKLEQWKSKHTKFYDNAIKTWTIRDVEKRKAAKENNLNFIEVWDINDIVNMTHLHKI